MLLTISKYNSHYEKVQTNIKFNSHLKEHYPYKLYNENLSLRIDIKIFVRLHYIVHLTHFKISRIDSAIKIGSSFLDTSFAINVPTRDIYVNRLLLKFKDSANY